MASVLCGDIALYSSQFPSFLYPHGTVYDEEDAGNGLFRGEYFLKVSFIFKVDSLILPLSGSTGLPHYLHRKFVCN
jgi:hypothetical protein